MLEEGLNACQLRIVRDLGFKESVISLRPIFVPVSSPRALFIDPVWQVEHYKWISRYSTGSLETYCSGSVLWVMVLIFKACVYAMSCARRLAIFRKVIATFAGPISKSLHNEIAK